MASVQKLPQILWTYASLIEGCSFKEEIMLVLTRGLKQKIEIGNNLVTVTVLEVKGGRVRLGIEAPADIPVRRQELVLAAASAVESVGT
jgi:carbon storage regulator